MAVEVMSTWSWTVEEVASCMKEKFGEQVGERLRGNY